MRSLAVFVMSVTTFSPLHAGEFNKVLSVGSPAPAFTELKGADGKVHSLAEWKDAKCVVVIFTCNSCPVANDYEARIAKAAAKYAGKAAFVAINSNSGPDDSLAKMTERATKKKYGYAYLHDATQAVAKAYGANYTPEFFVLDADRKVAYLGALDDKNKAEDAKVNFLDAAVDAVLAGKPAATGETLARGCKIKWKKEMPE